MSTVRNFLFPFKTNFWSAIATKSDNSSFFCVTVGREALKHFKLAISVSDFAELCTEPIPMEVHKTDSCPESKSITF
jgi:hypothetical protein